MRHHPGPAQAAFAAALLLGAGLSVRAQDGQTTNPKRVVFEHDARDVSGFVLYVRAEGGEALRFDLGPLKPDHTGRIAAPLPVLPDGVYSLEVAAYNAAGESPRVTAAPARVRMTTTTATTPTPTASSEHQQGASHEPAPDAAPAPADVAAKAPSPTNTEPRPDTTEPRKRRGFFERLGRIVIGTDD